MADWWATGVHGLTYGLIMANKNNKNNGDYARLNGLPVRPGLEGLDFPISFMLVSFLNFSIQSPAIILNSCRNFLENSINNLHQNHHNQSESIIINKRINKNKQK